MSTTVDQRVVEMRFDNKQFESGVSGTLSTLERLKKSLSLDGASKGLENVSAAAKSCDVSGVGSAVETVQAKFSAMSVVAITCLSNITNTAMNAGKNIIKALTIDPITTGFSEYETKMNSIQTIMSNTASKGTTMADVTKTIDELNTYADKTIYNFTEMTRNIGTFTAAGVGLEESAKAIQGIANLAAASGSNSQQASTAMYQLSQALATGTIRLMDWNSVVNAGMGGEKFQEAIKQTARDHGVAVDQIIEDSGSFRDSLQKEWLSADILNETLNKFTVDGAKNYAQSMMESGQWTQEQADALIAEAQAMEDAATKVKTFTQLWDTLKEAAQSGWGKTWEIIVGDFDEAKELFTEVSDVIGGMINASADARNKVLTEGLSSGWSQFLQKGVSDAEGYKEEIKAVAREHGISIDEMIQKEGSFESTLKNGWLTSDIMATSLSNLTDKTRDLSDEQLKNLGYTRDQAMELLTLDESVKSGSLSLDDFAKKMTVASGRENLIQSLRNAFEGVMSVIKPLSEAFRDVFPPITGEQILTITESLKNLTARLKLSNTQAKNLKRTFKGVFTVLKIVADVVLTVVSVAGKLVGKLFGVSDGFLGVTAVIGDALTNLGGFVKAAAQNIEFPGFEGFHAFLKLIQNGLSKTLDFLNKVKDGIVDVVSGIGQSLGKGLSSNQFDGFFGFINTLSFGAIAAGVVKFFKSISKPIESFKDVFGSIKGTLNGVTELLDGVRGCMEAYQNNLRANTLIKIAGAIALLVGSLLTLSTIDSGKMFSALAGMAGLFAELVIAMAVFEKIGGSAKRSAKTVMLMIGMATAVLILASAMKKLGNLSWEDTIKGLGSIGILIAMLVKTCKVLTDSSNEKDILKGSANILVFAVAINILALACKSLSGLSFEEIATGLSGIGVLLFEVSLFMKNTTFGDNAVKNAGSVLVLSVAIGILSLAVSKLGQLDTGGLVRGLLGLGAVLGGLYLFINNTTFGDNAVKNAASVLVLSIAIGILALAISKLGSMSDEGLAKGLIAIAGSLFIFSVALESMNETLPGSAALIVAAAAIAILAPALSLLGSMSWEGIGKALLTVAGAFVVFGVAAAVLASLIPAIIGLAPLLPAILGLAGALALIGLSVAALGVGLLAAGIGLTAMATGFGMLASMGAAGATAVVTALGTIITGIATLIPMIIVKIGEGLVALCGVIVEGAPAITEAFVVIIQSIVTALVESIPLVVDGMMQLLLALLNGVAENLPRLIQAGVDIIVAFAMGVASAIPQLVDAGFKAIIEFINGLAEAIRTNTPLLMDAVSNLFQAIIEAGIAILTGSVDMFSDAGDTIINSGLVDGIRSQISNVGNTVWRLVGSAKDKVFEWVGGFVDAGWNLITGLADGIWNAAGSVIDAAAGVAENILGTFRSVFDENSPSKETMQMGMYLDEGSAVGLIKGAKKPIAAAKTVGENMLGAMAKALSGTSGILDEINGEPTIQPVMDLSNIQNGLSQIDGFMGQQRSMALASTISMESNGQSIVNVIDEAIKSTVSRLSKQTETTANVSYTIEVPLYVNEREFARATAIYTQQELDKLNKINSRIGGVLG